MLGSLGLGDDVELDELEEELLEEPKFAERLLLFLDTTMPTTTPMIAAAAATTII